MSFYRGGEGVRTCAGSAVLLFCCSWTGGTGGTGGGCFWQSSPSTFPLPCSDQRRGKGVSIGQPELKSDERTRDKGLNNERHELVIAAEWVIMSLLPLLNRNGWACTILSNDLECACVVSHSPCKI